MNVVGLTGYAQHGKDSVGRMLGKLFGFTRYAFADQLKLMALRLDPIVHANMRGTTRLSELVEMEGWEAAKGNAEVRRFLQVLGTEAVRDLLGEDAWVDALERKVLSDGADKVVITDVRFENEAEWVRSNGGVVIRVNRPDFDNGVGLDHPSEKGVDSIVPDGVLSASNLEDLQVAVQAHRWD